MTTTPNRSHDYPCPRAAQIVAGLCLLGLSVAAWSGDAPCAATDAAQIEADTARGIDRAVAGQIEALGQARWVTAQADFARDTDAAVEARASHIAAQVAQAHRARLEARMYTRIALDGQALHPAARLTGMPPAAATPHRPPALRTAVPVAMAAIDCGPARPGPALVPPGSFR